MQYRKARPLALAPIAGVQRHLESRKASMPEQNTDLRLLSKPSSNIKTNTFSSRTYFPLPEDFEKQVKKQKKSLSN